MNYDRLRPLGVLQLWLYPFSLSDVIAGVIVVCFFCINICIRLPDGCYRQSMAFTMVSYSILIVPYISVDSSGFCM